jgi:hypothetical protein
VPFGGTADTYCHYAARTFLMEKAFHLHHVKGVTSVGAYYNTGQLSVALCTITDFAARDRITQLQLIRHKPWSVQEHADVRPRVAGRSFRYLEAFLPLNRT